MQEFEPFDIIHRPGKLHVNADFCSRPPVGGLEENPREAKQTMQATASIIVAPLNQEKPPLEKKEEARKTILVDTTERDRLRAEQRVDEELRPVIDYLTKQMLPSDQKKAAAIVAVSGQMELLDDVLYHLWWPQSKSHKLVRDTTRARIAVPQSMREEILTAYHDHRLGGHYGRKRTYECMRPKYWWPTMFKDVLNWVDTCSKAK